MKSLIYKNTLSTAEDTKNFVLEGNAHISFEKGAMRMENAINESAGQAANYVYWCPNDFPPDIEIKWDFMPLSSNGLCMMFFAAKGCDGSDIFASHLQKRTGVYSQYHSGDINAFHLSYYRRKEKDERAFHTCNLRKSRGFYLVKQGADPIPDSNGISDFYKMCITKKGADVSFSINGLLLLSFCDDGRQYGKLLEGGKIGFRQLAPLAALYKNLEVYSI